MVSRSARVGQAFGSKGVLNNAAKSTVEAVAGGGVTTANNDSAGLGSGVAGDLKFATNRKTLHMYDGTEWDRIAGGTDAAPVITEDASNVSVAASAIDSQRVKFKVTDPEGFPISYSISYMRDSDKVFFGNESSNMPPFLAHPAIITKADSGRATYRFITRTTESDGNGNATTDLYKARYFGTDGARHAVSTKDIQLSFKTDFTFDTSLSTINAGYTDTNKVDVTVTAYTTATSQQNGAMGKGYFEFKIIQDAVYLFIGVGSGTYNATYSGSGSMMIYYDGVIYPGPVSTGLGANNVDDIIMVAYDTTAEKVWFGMNGTWGTNMNPATDAGITVGGDPSTNGFRPIFNGGSSGASTFRVEIISHTQGAQYTIPTGWSLA